MDASSGHWSSVLVLIVGVVLLSGCGGGTDAVVEPQVVRVSVAESAPTRVQRIQPARPVQVSSAPAAAGVVRGDANDPFVAGETWTGSYTCVQGLSRLALHINRGGPQVQAVFDFAWRGVSGSYQTNGAYDPSARHIRLSAGGWLQQPSGFVAVDIDGAVSADGQTYSGKVLAPGCRDFLVRRGSSAPSSVVVTDPRHVDAESAVKGDCGEDPPSLNSCDALRDWLVKATDPSTMYTANNPDANGFRPLPSAPQLEDARATLALAEPKLAIMREERDWRALNLLSCEQAMGPTSNDIHQACMPERVFLNNYPNTAWPVRATLGPADKRAATLEAKEQTVAKQKADELARQQKAAEQASKAQQRTRCMAACQNDCSKRANYFDACVATCPGLCQM
jgi:hypothetical protein